MLRGSKVKISGDYGIVQLRGAEGILIGEYFPGARYKVVLLPSRDDYSHGYPQLFEQTDLELLEPPVEV